MNKELKVEFDLDLDTFNMMYEAINEDRERIKNYANEARERKKRTMAMLEEAKKDRERYSGWK